MKSQEKIWGVVDAEGKLLEAFSTRDEARIIKRWYNTVDSEFMKKYVALPVTIMQYKLCKKVR